MVIDLIKRLIGECLVAMGWRTIKKTGEPDGSVATVRAAAFGEAVMGRVQQPDLVACIGNKSDLIFVKDFSGNSGGTMLVKVSYVRISDAVCHRFSAKKVSKLVARTVRRIDTAQVAA